MHGINYMLSLITVEYILRGDKKYKMRNVLNIVEMHDIVIALFNKVSS